MYSTTMTKQILDFNKKAFDDSFNAVIVVQEHAEKMVRVFWEKSTFFPEEGKKVFGDWVNTYKNALDEFKANVDSRFKLIEDCVLSTAGQMESSFNNVVQTTDPIMPADDQITKKDVADIKKAVSRKPAAKREKNNRNKANKQT